jgi:hypothetical protein
LDKNIWESLNSNQINKSRKILRTTLDRNQIIEYDLIKDLSEKLILDSYNKNPTFERILKTSYGYNIIRSCHLRTETLCRWNISINIDTNEAILSSNKKCQHNNPIKRKGLF